jgi:dTDP-glucose 4,6-dehydratase
MTLLVSGGAGFIGSNFVLDWFAPPNASAEPIVVRDVLTRQYGGDDLAPGVTSA